MAGNSKAALYNTLDPSTTWYTFFLTTDPSITSVRLIGSWDNFKMSYSMERDSRRAGGQWRGCHAFKDIICDGDAAAVSSHTPIQPSAKRDGGLKMGGTYYYYYELDGMTETHNPALPSTTTCPYLPGQTVNTLCVPTTEQPVEQLVVEQPADETYAEPGLRHVSSFSSLRPSLRSVSSLSKLRRPLSPLPSPRKLLRSQRSLRSISPAPSLSATTCTSVAAPRAHSTWSPRRLFARRASPSREVTNANDLADDLSDDAYSMCQATSLISALTPAPSSASSSASASASASASVSSRSRLRYAALAPSIESHGSRPRVRDLSPESLRRFLVQDDVVETAVDGPAAQSCYHSIEDETDGADYDDDDDDDDHANFATSATSEHAPITILSPPPPSRNATPINMAEHQQAQPQTETEAPQITLRTSIPPPARPTRTPPAPLDVSAANVQQHRLSQMSLHPEMPACSSPKSLWSPASMTSLLPVSQSDADDVDEDDDDDDDDDDEDEHYKLAALCLPTSASFRAETSTGKSESQQQQQRFLFDAAAPSGSPATLTASDGSDSLELVDELGWMSTAIFPSSPSFF